MELREDNILVRPIEEDKVTAAGIIIPFQKNNRLKRGKVLLVGPGALNDKNIRIPLYLKPGDFVLFPWTFIGVEVIYENEKCWTMRECDVIATYEE